MGAYVNSDEMTKETWLAIHAVEVVSGELSFDKRPKDSLPIVLVHNGPFTAAAICYCESEFNCFTDKNDRRPKRFFYAKETDLHSVSPTLKTYLERVRP